MKAGALATLIALVLTALLTAFTGCGPSRPGTPEELYEQVARHNATNDFGKIWDLYTDDAKKAQMHAIDETRKTLRLNPHPSNDSLLKQWKSTREELFNLSYVELLRRESQGFERVFVDAKIIETKANPQDPNEVYVTIEPPAGPRVIMRARKVEGGWGLVQLLVRP